MNITDIQIVLDPKATVTYFNGNLNVDLPPARTTYTLAENHTYLVGIRWDQPRQAMILELFFDQRIEVEDPEYHFTFDHKIYGIDKTPSQDPGSISFGSFLIDGVTIWGMQGIGISDITDIKPDGVTRKSLVHTIDLLFSPQVVEFQKKYEYLMVRLAQRTGIVKIRIK